MARPKKDQTLQAVSIRLPEALLAEVDECARTLQEETPLFEINRTDALRYLIQLGLAQFERRAGHGRKPPVARS
jgi:metal-responsive CopG/Arc/MetJ family transcriptional regulator